MINVYLKDVDVLKSPEKYAEEIRCLGDFLSYIKKNKRSSPQLFSLGEEHGDYLIVTCNKFHANSSVWTFTVNGLNTVNQRFDKKRVACSIPEFNAFVGYHGKEFDSFFVSDELVTTVQWSAFYKNYSDAPLHNFIRVGGHLTTL